MGHYQKGAHAGIQLVVRIFTSPDVFREIARLGHLPDIVEIGTDPCQNGVGADLVGGGGGQIGECEAVMVSSRCLKREPLKEWVPEVGKLQQGHIGGQAGKRFKQGQQQEREERGAHPAADAGECHGCRQGIAMELSCQDSHAGQLQQAGNQTHPDELCAAPQTACHPGCGSGGDQS